MNYTNIVVRTNEPVKGDDGEVVIRSDRFQQQPTTTEFQDQEKADIDDDSWLTEARQWLTQAPVPIQGRIRFEFQHIQRSCAAGHLPEVRALLQYGSPRVVYQQDAATGNTALLIACQSGHSQVVGLLLSNGADASWTNRSGRTSLHYASEFGHTQIVQLLLLSFDLQPQRQQKVPHPEDGCAHLVNKPDRDGRTAVILASLQGHVKCVRLLLQHEALVNHIQDKQGQTALLSATNHGHVGVMWALLIQGNANPDEPSHDDQGCTALILASQLGNTQAVQLLLEQGAATGKRNRLGRTALVEAIQHGHVDIVRLLLTLEADANIADNHGWTALLTASCQGNVDLVLTLLNEGSVNVNHCDKRGRTALHIASDRGHTQVVRLLLAFGAVLDGRDCCYGDTALLLAIKNGHFDTVRLLLEYGNGTDMLHIPDKAGHTPLAVVTDRGQVAFTVLLLRYGADPNTKDRNGRTALHRAAYNNQFEIVRNMLEHGADTRIRDPDGKAAIILACEQRCMSAIFLLLQRMVGEGSIVFEREETAADSPKSSA